MQQYEKVISFVETFLSLGGSFDGQPFKLMDFQKEVIEDIYRTDDKGKRLRKKYVLGLPRKNGKSQLAAALALYHLVIDASDPRPLVISAAADRSQARLVFQEAKRMVQASPELSSELVIYQNEIQNPNNGGVYKAVSADAGLQQGLNPSFVVMDELHVFKNGDLMDALTMGSAMRKQPLFLVISTAGFDLNQPLGKLYQYGLRVDGHMINGVKQPAEETDESFGMCWYGPELGDEFDRTDQDIWKLYNPAHSIMNLEVLESALKSSTASAFIRFHLNGWTSSEEQWLPVGAWEALEAEEPIPDGAPVVLGVDAAWRGDCTAIVACSTDDFKLELVGFWEKPVHQPDWNTPVLDVEQKLLSLCGKYNVVEICADPFRFERSLEVLRIEHGLNVVEFPTNSLQRIVPACQTFFEGVADGNISHHDSPALTRHLANALMKEDARGIRITKAYRSSTRHIDAAIAAVIAYSRARAFIEVEAPRDPVLIVI